MEGDQVVSSSAMMVISDAERRKPRASCWRLFAASAASTVILVDGGGRWGREERRSEMRCWLWAGGAVMMMISLGRLASQESMLLKRLEDALMVAQTIVAVGSGDEGEGKRRRAVRRE